MTSIVQRVVSANVWLSRRFDDLFGFPPHRVGTLQPYELRTLFMAAHNIADVGGGKKPYAVVAGIDVGTKTYVGFDLDPDELSQAPEGSYTKTDVIDICDTESTNQAMFDLVLCRSTLEHVRDSAAAVSGLCSLVAPGGKCYVRLPCRRAAFAQLNLLLPNAAKRSMLHATFPHKRGDGFPVFYDRCLPSAIRQLVEENGLIILAQRRNLRSTYFTFFFPLYVIWRIISMMQYMIDPEYCESFEMVFERPSGHTLP